MTTDTSKITGAADELSAGLAKGGTAAKTLGAEIANAIKSLDSRVVALETAKPVDPPPTEEIPPPEQGSGPTGGKITNFTGPNNSDSCKIDGIACGNHSANKPYSIKQVDDYTLRFEVHAGDHTWSQDSDAAMIQRDVNYRNGTAIKLAYRAMIEAGSPNSADWFTFGEWHNDDGQNPGGVATSPPIVIELAGEKFQAVARWCRPGGNPSNAQGSDLKQAWPWKQAQNFVRGQWYVFEHEFKTDQSNGYWKLKLDGQEVMNYTGPLGYGCDIYWMEGLYRKTGGPNIAAQFKNLTLDPMNR